MSAVSEALPRLSETQTVLRCFHVPISQVRILNNRAGHRRVPVDELVVEAIQMHLQNMEKGSPKFQGEKVEGDYGILLTFYITLEQARRLNDLALLRKTETTKLLSEILSRYVSV